MISGLLIFAWLVGFWHVYMRTRELHKTTLRHLGEFHAMAGRIADRLPEPERTEAFDALFALVMGHNRELIALRDKKVFPLITLDMDDHMRGG